MNKKIPAKDKRLVKLVKQVRINTVLPFAERPSVSSPQGTGARTPLNAVDLFSHFTANIIKEEVVFTR